MELLVVITIIGILVGLLVPAVAGARKSALQRQIGLEIATVAQAIESYRNDVSGGAYPPDVGIGTVGTGPGETPPVQANALWSDFNRHFKKAFPRSREPQALLRGLAGFTTMPGGGSLPAGFTTLVEGMSPAESLVFFLQSFSSDPQYPISGPGGPSFVVLPSVEVEDLGARNWITNFEATRYGMLVGGARASVAQVYETADANDDGVFSATELATIPRNIRYEVDADGDGQDETRQINFWQYFTPNSPLPLVYYDASRGIHDVDYNVLFFDGNHVHPLKRLKPGQTQRIVGNLEPANAGKFQILHSGLDEAWGDWNAIHVEPTAADADPFNGFLFPDGPFTLELADTIVNFSDNATLEDSQQ